MWQKRFRNGFDFEGKELGKGVPQQFRFGKLHQAGTNSRGKALHFKKGQKKNWFFKKGPTQFLGGNFRWGLHFNNFRFGTSKQGGKASGVQNTELAQTWQTFWCRGQLSEKLGQALHSLNSVGVRAPFGEYFPLCGEITGGVTGTPSFKSRCENNGL